MEKLTKDISDIIITEINTTNEKVRGLNFLELLKTNLIEIKAFLYKKSHIA